MSAETEHQLPVVDLVQAAEAYRQAVTEHRNARQLAQNAKEQHAEAEHQSFHAENRAKEAFDHLIDVVLGRDEP